MDLEEKIIDKIARVLQLARSESTPKAESEAAFVTASKMLLKHNIDLLDVDGRKEKSSLVEKSFRYREKEAEGAQWEHDLLSVICRFNFSKLLSNRWSVFIVGREDNVDVVIYMFNAARFVYRASARKAYRELAIEISALGMGRPPSRGRFVRSFLLGCSEGLELKLQREAETKRDKFALVVADTGEENDAFVDEKYGVLGKGRRRVNQNSPDYRAKLAGFNCGFREAIPEGIGQEEKAFEVTK